VDAGTERMAKLNGCGCVHSHITGLHHAVLLSIPNTPQRDMTTSSAHPRGRMRMPFDATLC
jgi:hypothetical protein